MPVELSIKKEDRKVISLLEKLYRKTGDLTPAMRMIGEIVLSSIQHNFEVGGRPDKWTGLSPATILNRIAKKKWPGQILVRKGVSGGLMGDVHYRAYPDKTELSANKVYAAIQHFGGKTGRGHKITIPARPFMLVQRDDWREIKDSIMDFIYGG